MYFLYSDICGKFLKKSDEGILSEKICIATNTSFFFVCVCVCFYKDYLREFIILCFMCVHTRLMFMLWVTLLF